MIRERDPNFWSLIPESWEEWSQVMLISQEKFKKMLSSMFKLQRKVAKTLRSQAHRGVFLCSTSCVKCVSPLHPTLVEGVRVLWFPKRGGKQKRRKWNVGENPSKKCRCLLLLVKNQAPVASSSAATAASGTRTSSTSPAGWTAWWRSALGCI